jgi:hypothetical protein
MTEIPNNLVGNWGLLRNIWYRKLLPKEPLKLFKVFAWRVLAINVGGVAGAPILLSKLNGDEQMNLSFSNMEREFVLRDQYIQFAEEKNYQLKAEINSELIFEHKESDS